jgi:ribosome-binding protein aMBF1 (putative translation factor)
MARCFAGRRLRDARIAAGLSPERLALAVERSVFVVHDYERGRALPSVTVLARLAHVLAVPIDDLFAASAEEEVGAGVA